MNREDNIDVNITAANIDSLHLRELTNSRLQAGVLRLDKIHPVISGNKWFKLRYHLDHALAKKQTPIITFGGAYSNHIVATACACKQKEMQSIGVIRGERPAILSYTLKTAESYGMHLLFVSREAYTDKQDSEPVLQLFSQYSNPYIIPEGGAGEEGIRGSREILQLHNFKPYSHIMCCIGTGTMFTGLSQSLHPGQQLTGIPVLKMEAEAAQLLSIKLLLQQQGLSDRCHILTGYHFGGYAKKTGQLLDFMNNFYARTGIPTDFVYTGKLLFAFLQLVENNYFAKDSNVLIIHSGGLQGNVSLPRHTLTF